jgi:hypothetical protein
VWRLHVHRQPVGARGEQELASTRGFEPGSLRLAQVERLLELRGLARPLRAEEVQGRVRGDDGARVAAEEVAGVLGGRPRFRHPRRKKKNEARPAVKRASFRLV